MKVCERRPGRSRVLHAATGFALALAVAAAAEDAPVPGAPPAEPKSNGLKPWTLGAPVPHRSFGGAPAVAVGDWVVCVDGTNDDCFGARQQADGKLSSWEPLAQWGLGRTNHGNASVCLGDVAFNVADYTRRIRLQDGKPSKWEFPVPGDQIEPKNGKPRQMVWSGAAALAVEGRTFVYYLGGFEYKGGLGKDPASIDVVYYAETTGKGELSAWKATTPRPYPAMNPSGVGANGRVYVLGGSQKFTPPERYHDEIVSAKANPDGSLGKWELSGRLPRAMSGSAVFYFGGYLYVLGGEAGGKPCAECFRAPVLKDGRVGGWQAQPPLPKPAGLPMDCFCIINRYVYVIGECESGKPSASSVYISKF